MSRLTDRIDRLPRPLWVAIVLAVTGLVFAAGITVAAEVGGGPPLPVSLDR